MQPETKTKPCVPTAANSPHAGSGPRTAQGCLLQTDICYNTTLYLEYFLRIIFIIVGSEKLTVTQLAFQEVFCFVFTSD